MIAASSISLTISNRRAARCARCRRPVRKGAGVPYLEGYLCGGCARMVAAEEQALAASRWSLEVIGGMLDWSRPLGFVDEQRVKNAIRRRLAQGARSAYQLAVRIEQGQTFTVWQVVDAIAKGQDFSN